MWPDKLSLNFYPKSEYLVIPYCIDILNSMKKKSKDITIEDLAIMVANGFGTTHKEIAEVKHRLCNVEDRLGNVEENLKATRRDVLDIGDRFVPRYEFDNLLIRFGRIEQKVLGKRTK